MNNTPQIIRLEPNGPASSGLAKMNLDPADYQSDPPVQHIHYYFEDPDLGISIGVWTTTSMQEILGPYPCDEYMFVLEGQVAMVDGAGRETPVRQGEAFSVRSGIPISWTQDGFLRKFFMIYAPPNTPVPEIASADGGVLVHDLVMLEAGLTPLDTTDPFEILGDTPVQRDNILFTNDAGNMFTGMWDSTAFESEMKPFPCHELVHLLEGEVTITEASGASSLFQGGDTFFVPMGTECSWKAADYIRKLYAILDPAAG